MGSDYAMMAGEFASARANQLDKENAELRAEVLRLSKEADLLKAAEDVVFSDHGKGKEVYRLLKEARARIEELEKQVKEANLFRKKVTRVTGAAFKRIMEIEGLLGQIEEPR